MPSKDSYFRIWTGIHRAVFKSTKGRVAGRALGMPVLVLTTFGRTSGQRRETMLTTPLQLGESFVLAASFGGDDREPSWCKNIRHNADVTVTMRGSRRQMKARVTTPEERAELWPQVASAHPNYAEYQTKTEREIPLVLVEP